MEKPLVCSLYSAPAAHSACAGTRRPGGPGEEREDDSSGPVSHAVYSVHTPELIGQSILVSSSAK